MTKIVIIQDHNFLQQNLGAISILWGSNRLAHLNSRIILHFNYATRLTFVENSRFDSTCTLKNQGSPNPYSVDGLTNLLSQGSPDLTDIQVDLMRVKLLINSPTSWTGGESPESTDLSLDIHGGWMWEWSVNGTILLMNQSCPYSKSMSIHQPKRNRGCC